MFCENCGNKIHEDTQFCPKCGNKTGEITIKTSEKPVEEGNIKPGIRDWLVLVAVGLIISPLFYLYSLFTVYLPIFTDSTWGLLTNSNSAYYTSGIGGGLIFEIVFQSLFLVASLYLLFLFFKNNRKFPQFYIIYLASIVIFGIIDSAIISSIPSMASETRDNSGLGKAIVFALIWIPYMLKSKLVKATFTK